jgi:hypothetical protein
MATQQVYDLISILEKRGDYTAWIITVPEGGRFLLDKGTSFDKNGKLKP